MHPFLLHFDYRPVPKNPWLSIILTIPSNKKNLEHIVLPGILYAEQALFSLFDPHTIQDTPEIQWQATLQLLSFRDRHLFMNKGWQTVSWDLLFNLGLFAASLSSFPTLEEEMDMLWGF